MTPFEYLINCCLLEAFDYSNLIVFEKPCFFFLAYRLSLIRTAPGYISCLNQFFTKCTRTTRSRKLHLYLQPTLFTAVMVVTVGSRLPLAFSAFEPKGLPYSM